MWQINSMKRGKSYVRFLAKMPGNCHVERILSITESRNFEARSGEEVWGGSKDACVNYELVAITEELYFMIFVILVKKEILFHIRRFWWYWTDTMLCEFTDDLPQKRNEIEFYGQKTLKLLLESLIVALNHWWLRCEFHTCMNMRTGRNCCHQLKRIKPPYFI